MFSREDGEKYGEQRKLTSGVYWDVHRARKVDNAVELNSYIHVLNEYKTVPLFNCLSSLVHIQPPRHADCGNLPLVLFAVTIYTTSQKNIAPHALLVLCSHDE